jgi:hypothetical protein
VKSRVAVVAGLAILLLALTPLTSFAQAVDHCPDHDGHPDKVEDDTGSVSEGGVTVSWTGDPGVVTITNTSAQTVTVVFCAKGGTGFSGGDQTSGQRTVTLDPDGTESFTFGTEISYLIVYDISFPGSGLIAPTGATTSGTGRDAPSAAPASGVPLLGATLLAGAALVVLLPIRGVLRRRSPRSPADVTGA